MNAQTESCFVLLNRNSLAATKAEPVLSLRAPKPGLSLSCQAGAVGGDFPQRLAAHLAASEECMPGWEVYDQNLIEAVLKQHSLSQRLGRFMPEDTRSPVEELMEELLGAHPAMEILLNRVEETLLQLAGQGRVVLVGRAANLITQRVPGMFHVRLVGSLEKRIALVQELRRLEKPAALAWIEKEDAARGRYVRQHYHRGIDDPQGYNLVLSTDGLTAERIAEVVAQHAMRFFEACHVEWHPRLALSA